MQQLASDVLRIMRRAIGRKNVNDPESTDAVLYSFINEFINLTMSDDIKLFEQFGTFSFTIDETRTTGVYTIDELQQQNGQLFSNLSMECYISLLNPINNSVSWNYLPIYQDPAEFFAIWGINNTEILIPGYPTNLLYYGEELTFRTIPNTSYLVNIYSYKQNNVDYSGSPNESLPVARWARYVAYGAANNYAQDYRYEAGDKAQIEKGFSRERKLLLTNTHNQAKLNRCFPRF